MNKASLQLHHIGCLVRDIDQTMANFKLLVNGAPASPAVRVASQKVWVVFLPLHGGLLLELVQPDPDNRFLNRLLDRGTSFYHLAYLTSDLSKTEIEWIQTGAKLLTRFSSEAFEGRECVFLLTTEGQMLELIAAPGAS